MSAECEMDHSYAMPNIVIIIEFCLFGFFVIYDTLHVFKKEIVRFSCLERQF